jgi:ADP-ribose pyrophosphatase
VVIHPGAVAIVPLLPDGGVVMVRQYRHATGAVLYELPAGTLAPGESPLACARRELAEETGYEAEHVKLLFSTYLSPGYSSEIIHVVVASGLRAGAGAGLEEDERLEVVALPLAEAVAMVRRGEVQNAAAICGLLGVKAWGGPGAGGTE